mmetsp:Transcript_26227/g.42480  ORF Transcript_26227/g.42480 Transcript_26227/m.42480 type:complete len:327 (+) Transcript_26227:193-1173(+)
MKLKKDADWLDVVSKWEVTWLMVPLQRFENVYFGMLMHFLGQVCTGEGLVVCFALLNWCFDNRMGTQGIWLVPIAEVLNGMIKWVFQVGRPGWVHKSVVQKGGTSHEYSFPSSHSMISFSLAVYFSEMTGWWVPYFVAGAVAFSRIYEGMHYPHDVVVGGFLGIVLGRQLLFVLDLWSSVSVGSEMLIMFGSVFCCFTIIVIALCYKCVKQVRVPDVWNENAKTTLKPAEEPLKAYIGMSGVLFGLTIGEVLFDPFMMPETFLCGVLRLLVGFFVLLGLFFGIRACEKLVPSSYFCCGLILRFIRFAQVPPTILIVCPFLFNVLSI